MTPAGPDRENEELRRRLAEAEEALAAIRGGQVDAIVTEGVGGPQIFSLSGVETIYRVAVETMAEAFINTTVEGTILFCNDRFAEFVGMPMEHVLGRGITEFVPDEDLERVRTLLEECARQPIRQRVVFRGGDRSETPVMLTGRAQAHDDGVTLCLVAADRTEPERQLRSLERVNRLYAVLSHVNEAILRVADQQALFEAACRIAVDDGGFVLAWIGLADVASGSVGVAAKYGRGEGYLEDITVSTEAGVLEGQEPTAVSLRECRPVICNGTAEGPSPLAPWREAQLAHGLKASASFPLRVGEDCVGAMTLYASESGVFDEEELRLLAGLADDLSFALEAGRLERERQTAVAALQRSRDELELRVEQRTSEIRALYEEQMSMATELKAALESRAEAQRRTQRELANTQLLEGVAEATASTSLEGVAEGALRAIVNGMNAQVAAIFTYDPSAGVLTLLAGHGTESIVDRYRTIPVTEDSHLRVVQSVIRKEVVMSRVDLSDAERTTLSKQLDAETMQGIGIPLLHRGEAVGACSLLVQEREPADEVDLDVLRSLARILAQGIASAQLFAAHVERRRLSDALNAVDSALHSTLDSDLVIQHALDAGVRALACDAGAVEMLEAETWVVRYQHGFSADDVGMRMSRDESPNATRAARSREAFAIADMTEDPAVNVGFVRHHGLRSVVAVPLIIRESVVGCAFFYTTSEVRVFTEAEIDFVRRFASSVSLGLENARLYEAEHDVADKLQAALLALPDEVPGIEFAHAYHSAAETARVGGDFYDLFELDHDHVGIMIGDVAGKGLDAAVLTSMVKNTIRAHASEQGKTPALILDLTNRIVHRATPPEAFATVFFGILDCRDGRLAYSNAGHTTSAVLGADRGIGKLSVTGPLLGAFQGASFEQAESRLGVDDLLFLYTDGLTEARRDGELYGEERLFEFLASMEGGSPRAIVKNAIDEVIGFSGARLRDDLAILAVKRAMRSGESARQ